MIAIKGVYNVGGEQDIIELMTCGRLYRQEGCYWLCYDESETTGFAGHRTTLRVESQRVTMKRSGESATQLIVEQGRRHQCSYNTGYGAVMLGVSGGKVHSTLSDEGGQVDFSYSMDIDTALASENRIIIQVTPQHPPVPSTDGRTPRSRSGGDAPRAK